MAHLCFFRSSLSALLGAVKDFAGSRSGALKAARPGAGRGAECGLGQGAERFECCVGPLRCLRHRGYAWNPSHERSGTVS